MASSEPNKDGIIKAKNNPDWVVMVSKRLRRIYYFNSKTADSVWEKPEELIFTADDMEKLTGKMNELESLNENKNRLNNKRVNCDDIFPSSRSIVLPPQYSSETIEQVQNRPTEFNSEENRVNYDFIHTRRSKVLPHQYSSETIEQDQNRRTEFNSEENGLNYDFIHTRRSRVLPHQYSSETIEQGQNRPTEFNSEENRVNYDFIHTRRSRVLPHQYSSETIEQDQNRRTEFNSEENGLNYDFIHTSRSIVLPPQYSSETIEQDQNRPTEFNSEENRVNYDFIHTRRFRVLPHQYSSETIEQDQNRPTEFNSEDNGVNYDFPRRSRLLPPGYSSESIEQDFEPSTPLNNTIDVTSASLDEIIKHKKMLNKRQERSRPNRQQTKINSYKKHLLSKLKNAECRLEDARKTHTSQPLRSQLLRGSINSNQEENHDTSMEWEDVDGSLNARTAPKIAACGWFENKFDTIKIPTFDSELAIVLDTNVLLASLNFIKSMKNKPYDEFPAKFIVPYQVLAELDHLKRQKSSSFRSIAARKAINMLHVALGKQHTRIIGQPADKDRDKNEYMTSTLADDFILNCCLQYKEEGYNVILFTGDKNLTTRALMNGIESISEKELKIMSNITPSNKKRRKHKNGQRTSFGRTHSMDDSQDENDSFMSRANNMEGLQSENNMEGLQSENNIEGLQSENDSFTAQNEPEEDLRSFNPDNSYCENETGSEFDTTYERTDFENVQNESIALKPDDNISNFTTGSEFDTTYERTDFENVQNESIALKPDDNISNFTTEENCPSTSASGQSKKAPQYGIILLNKLKNGLMYFLTTVLKIPIPNMNAVNGRISEEITFVLNNCLSRMQLDWTDVMSQPLLEDDIVCLRVLKSTLLIPIEEISWTQRTVEELMAAAIKLANSFVKYDKHVLSATSFIVLLRDCQDVEKRLNHEIEQMELPGTEIGENCEVLLAEAAFGLCLSLLCSVCNVVPQEYNLKKNEGQAALDEYMDGISKIYTHVTDLFNGITGVLKEDVKSLKLTNPSIQLLFNTLVATIPESTPIVIPNTSNTPTEPYFTCDLSSQCVLAFCSRQDQRKKLTEAKDIIYKFWYTISKCCDEYCGLNI